MPRNRRTIVVCVLLTICALITAACGQKAGVHLTSAGSSAGGGTSDALTGAGGDTGGDTGAGAASGASGGSTTGGSSTGSAGSAAATGSGTSGGSTGRSGGTSGGGTSGGGGGTASTPGNDRTGITDDTIVIGVHGPASGAGAPATSFYKYKQLYFDRIGKAINGRRVVVEFADDGYNPSQAVQACKTLVQDKHVFLLVGAAGTDQIVECAKYARSAGVPYLAEGVTEAALAGVNNYFAETMTYKAQGPLLVQYMKNVAKKTKWAMIRGNTANFEDAHTGFVNAANAAGMTKIFDDAVPKDGTNQDMQSEAQKFCKTTPNPGGPLDKSDVALYPLMSPKLFIAFAGFVAQAGCFPRYAGIGITLALNVVASAVCPSGAFQNGATFFSPYVGLDQADPEFKAATQGQSDADDIAYGIWAAEKLFAAELQAAGRDLSRQSFMQTLLTKKVFEVNTYPKVDFSNSHFGGTAVSVQRADCTKNPGAYVTEAVNKSSF